MENDFSIEKFREVIAELFQEKAPTLEPDDLNYIGPIGDGWYKIGPGAYCGKAGFELFEKALREESKKSLK